MFSSMIALLLAVSAQPETAEQKSEETPEETVQEKAEDKRICRYIRPDMSSRRKQRVCMTDEQWREFNRGN